MAVKRISKHAGLYTSVGELSESPEGALVRADNCVIKYKGVIEPRRGFQPETNTFSSAVTSKLAELWFFQSQRLLNFNDTSSGWKMARSTTGGAWTSYSGTYTPPDATYMRMKFADAQKSTFFTTSGGVYRLSTVTDTPSLAGVVHSPGVDFDVRKWSLGIGALVRTSNVVTATTGAAHGFYVGQKIQINTTATGSGASFAAGTFTVVSVPGSTSFTYSEAGSNSTSTATSTCSIAVLVDTGVVLADGYHAAYRTLFDDPDANVKNKLSSVSGRTVIANASSTTGYVAVTAKNVIVRVLLPTGVSTSTYVRLYRSESCLTTITPSEDLGLVYEVRLKSTDISRGYIDIYDVVPDALIAQSIYTSPNEGSSPADNNYRPPLCNDLAWWKSRMFAAYTTDLQRFTFNIVGTDGLGVGTDYFYIGSEQYLMLDPAATNGASNSFVVSAAASTALKLQQTAVSLVSAINRTSTLWFAEYTSGPADPPGQISLFARAPNATAVKFTGSDSGVSQSFAPVFGFDTSPSVTLSRTSNVVTATAGLPFGLVAGSVFTFSGAVTGGGGSTFGAGPFTVTSVSGLTWTYAETGANDTYVVGRTVTDYNAPTTAAEVVKNRVFYSKLQQPEAFPLTHYFDVGAADKRIWRIAPLNDKLFVLKEDGIFIVSGDAPFRVDCLDPTTQITKPDSVQSVGNALYFVSNQGVVSVTESGVAKVSEPVDQDVDADGSQGAQYSAWGNWSAGYETEGLYLVNAVFGGYADHQIGLGCFSKNGWTVWPDMGGTSSTGYTFSAGRVDPSTNKLHLVGATKVHVERKDYVASDYADAEYAFTVTSFTSSTVTGTTSTAPEVGDFIGDGRWGIVVTSVSGSGPYTVGYTYAYNYASFAAGATTGYKAIPTRVEYAAECCEAPEAEKFFRKAVFQFRRYDFTKASAGFASDKSYTETAVAIPKPDQSTHVSGGFAGVYPTHYPPVNKHLMVPQAKEHAAYLRVSFSTDEARAMWALNGLSLVYEMGSDQGSR